MFSPFYKKANDRSSADPEAHAAVNLALYNLKNPGGSWLGPAFGKRNGDLWALTEGARVARNRDKLTIGETTAQWLAGNLVIDINETTAPFASRLRGKLIVRPSNIQNEVFTLDPAGRHIWSPLAPFGRIDVTFQDPRLAWSGPAYLDHNAGDEPLARGFKGWNWSRVTTREHTTVVYDVVHRDGGTHQIARSFFAGGARENRHGTPRTVQLPKTRWQMDRSVRVLGDGDLKVAHTLEDTPFYSRSHLTGTLDGHAADGVHESVDMDRFESPVVQAMLPYRMRRHRA
ncbi:MAG: hypothetical protein IPK82_11020 [Polyangiaceae bacterium]|nr:hypothetical protein [Polyangiaceae bacterium]